jgi:uncharacterized protein YukE
MKLNVLELKRELEAAFGCIQETRKKQAEIIIKLTSPSDDFQGELAQRFDKQRSKTDHALEQITELLENTEEWQAFQNWLIEQEKKYDGSE